MLRLLRELGSRPPVHDLVVGQAGVSGSPCGGRRGAVRALAWWRGTGWRGARVRARHGRHAGARRPEQHGLRPLPGALEITRWAAAARAAVLRIHQRDQSRRPRAMRGRLRQVGFPLPDEAMLTPAIGAVRVLLRRPATSGSWCSAARGSPSRCEEAGIETLPPLRGRRLTRCWPAGTGGAHLRRAGGGVPGGLGRGRVLQRLAVAVLRDGRRAGHWARPGRSAPSSATLTGCG